MPAAGQAVTVLPLGDLLASFLRRGRPWPMTIKNSMARTGQEWSPGGERADVQHGPWTPGQRPASQPRADEPGQRRAPGRGRGPGPSLICATPPARRTLTGRPMTWAPPIRTARSGMTRSAVTAPQANSPRSIPTAFTAHSPPTAEAAKTHRPTLGKQRARRPRRSPPARWDRPGSAESPGSASGSAGSQIPAESPGSSGPPGPGPAQASEERSGWGAAGLRGAARAGGCARPG